MTQPKMGTGRPDDFQTPASALLPLLPYVNKDWEIWECACGKGSLAVGLLHHGYSAIGTDIKTGFDFLKWQPDRFDCIITNPPFTLKQQFLERCYSLGKPFALLLPLTALETPKRQMLFKTYGVEILFMDKRVHFETPSGGGSGSWFATAWFTWGLNIGQAMTFTGLQTTAELPLFAAAG